MPLEGWVTQSLECTPYGSNGAFPSLTWQGTWQGASASLTLDLEEANVRIATCGTLTPVWQVWAVDATATERKLPLVLHQPLCCLNFGATFHFDVLLRLATGFDEVKAERDVYVVVNVPLGYLHLLVRDDQTGTEVREDGYTYRRIKTYDIVLVPSSYVTTPPTGKKRSAPSATTTTIQNKPRKADPPAFDTYLRRWPTPVDGTNLKKVVESYFPAQRSACVVFGKPCTVPRDEVMFTDHPERESYVYSHHQVPLKAFTPELDELRQHANAIASELMGRPVHFAQVLLNGYSRNRRDRVGWHKDDEATVDQTYPIVSFSFGDTRDFVVKREADGAQRVYPLRDGDVVIMMPGTQTHFRHAVPPRAGQGERRYNLTFRVYRNQHSRPKPSSTIKTV